MNDTKTAAGRDIEQIAQDLRQLGVAVDDLTREDLAILVLSAKGLQVTEIGSALSLSRYAIPPLTCGSGIASRDTKKRSIESKAPCAVRFAVASKIAKVAKWHRVRCL